MLSFMELMIHAMIMEFFESHTRKNGSASSGFGFNPVIYPSLPRPRITILTEVDHWRIFFPLNLWEVICREADDRSEEGMEGMDAVVEADWTFLDKASEFAEFPLPAPVSAYLYISLN